MTEDKDIIKNLEYLDKILSYLIHDCKAYTTDFKSLYWHFYKRDLDEDKKLNIKDYFKTLSTVELVDGRFLTFYIADNTLAEGEKLVEACFYLMKQSYVLIDENFNLKITFDGIIEFSKGGLIKKHKSESYKEWLDIFNVYVTIAISLASLVVGYLLGK